MDEDTHPLHVVVELLVRESLHDGRDLAERSITRLLRKENVDVEFDFAFLGRSVKQNLVRGDTTAQQGTHDGGKGFGTSHQPGIRPSGKLCVQVGLLKVTVLRYPLEKSPGRAEQS